MPVYFVLVSSNLFSACFGDSTFASFVRKHKKKKKVMKKLNDKKRGNKQNYLRINGETNSHQVVTVAALPPEQDRQVAEHGASRVPQLEHRFLHPQQHEGHQLLDHMRDAQLWGARAGGGGGNACVHLWFLLASSARFVMQTLPRIKATA